jgi:adenylate kinase
VRENVEAELLGTCLVDALETQDSTKITEIDTTNQTPEETAETVLAILNGEIAPSYGSIDWMSKPEAETLLRDK